MDNTAFIDVAQLAAWRDWRIAQPRMSNYHLIVCYQAQRNRLQRTEVNVSAESAEDASRIALSRYQKMYPRRKQAWVEKVERVHG